MPHCEFILNKWKEKVYKIERKKIKKEWNNLKPWYFLWCIENEYALWDSIDKCIQANALLCISKPTSRFLKQYEIIQGVRIKGKNSVWRRNDCWKPSIISTLSEHFQYFVRINFSPFFDLTQFFSKQIIRILITKYR